MRTTSRIFAYFVLPILFFSCKKETATNDSGYYFSAKFDGETRAFNTSMYAARINDGFGLLSVTINGTRLDTAGLEITLWEDQDTVAVGKTYVTSTSGGMTNSLLYVSPLYPVQVSDTSVWNTTFPLGVVDQKFTCTITELTSDYIKGTFSGVLYRWSGSPTLTINVTEGQFRAKFN